MKYPNCPSCQKNDNVVPLHISTGWSSSEIRFGNNGIHDVKFFTCGFCRGVFIDDDTSIKIMKTKN